ncbi:protein WVD2-like 7 [Sesamum indicum]|uniref:Protein WVD2-like 7 n=1 Tax=Sesamum indicum TaxID=4182 RepID=A0A6I9SL91_SESIN|nr:protein WVD2-like 7 [Sesamum indicum]XP_011070632.1 protein WVD2-like 7 [Sesamum indicum]
MAGEIEEPLALNFQIGFLHSGSISFGRFENESLCWERRSTFSRNRYLEDVQKYSKPGSVTEKKAYFEAHFRKKGFLGLNSPECQNETEYQTGENDISEEMGNEEDINHMNGVTRSAPSDEIMDGLVHGGEHEVMECETEGFGTLISDHQSELETDCPNNVDYVPGHFKIEEADDTELGVLLPLNHNSGSGTGEIRDGETADSDTSHVPEIATGSFTEIHANDGNSDANLTIQQGSLSKEKTPPELEYMQPRLVPRVSVQQRRRYTSRNASKRSESKANKTVPLRSKTENKTLAATNKLPMHKAPEYEPASKKKEVCQMRRAENRSINSVIAVPQSSISTKVSCRVHQNGNRVTPAVGRTKPSTRQDNSRFNLKSDDRAQRRKEFDMKLEEKMHAKEAQLHQLQEMTKEKTKAEIKQLRKNLNFKAMPMPAFYRRAVRERDRNEAIGSDVKPWQLLCESSSSALSAKVGTGQAILIKAPTKTSDPQHASGATSCYSTVTSDSNAETGNCLPSQAGRSHLVSQKKEVYKEKHTSVPKHKVAECNQIYKGETFDRIQKTRTERSTRTSLFKFSSRRGQVAVDMTS